MNPVVTQLAAALSVALVANPALAQTGKSGVERLYIIDCGTSVGPDKSRWTPGVDVGKPLDMVGDCYLIRHTRGWMIWDTGLTDEVANMPDGRPCLLAQHKAQLWINHDAPQRAKLRLSREY